MVDVIVETDTTFMDRVRSRVRSLPGYPLERLLDNVERSADVEDLDDIWSPERQSHFAKQAVKEGTNLAASDLQSLPDWKGDYIALKLVTSGDVPSRVALHIADEFARFVAYEIGETSGRHLLTDCVVGSITFQIKIDIKKKFKKKLAMRAIMALTASAVLYGAVDNKDNPQLVDWCKDTADALSSYQIDKITLKSSSGLTFTCDAATFTKNAKGMPDADYRDQDSYRPGPSTDYGASGSTFVLQGTGGDEGQLIVRHPLDAQRQLGEIILYERDLEAGGNVEVQGHWITHDGEDLFFIERLRPLPNDAFSEPIEDHGNKWRNALGDRSSPPSSGDAQVGPPS